MKTYKTYKSGYLVEMAVIDDFNHGIDNINMQLHQTNEAQDGKEPQHGPRLKVYKDGKQNSYFTIIINKDSSEIRPHKSNKDYRTLGFTKKEYNSVVNFIERNIENILYVYRTPTVSLNKITWSV